MFDGRLGACHGLELPFAFGRLDGAGTALFAGSGPTVDRLSERVMDAWTAFARCGDPSHEGIGNWPRYEPVRRATMRLDRECGVELDPEAARRQLCEWIVAVA